MVRARNQAIMLRLDITVGSARLLKLRRRFWKLASAEIASTAFLMVCKVTTPASG